MARVINRIGVAGMVLSLALGSAAFAGEVTDQDVASTMPYSAAWSTVCLQTANSERPLPDQKNAFPTFAGSGQDVLKDRCAPYTQAVIAYGVNHQFAKDRR